MPGAYNPRGQNFDVNRNLLSLRSFAISKKSLFFHDFIMYISPGQGLTAPWGRNFDVNRNLLSLWPFATSLKKNVFEV